MNNKKITKPKLNKPTRFYNSMGVKITMLALMFGITAKTLMYEEQTNEIENLAVHQQKEELLHIGLSKDLPSDEFDGSIPIYAQNGEDIKAFVKDNTIIISNKELKKHKFDLQRISTIDVNNNVVDGYVERKHIDNIISTHPENISTVYNVATEKGLNLRNTPSTTENNIQNELPQNSILLGGSSDENSEHKWTEVIYFNNNTLTKGFVSGNLVQELGSIQSYMEQNNINSIGHLNNEITKTAQSKKEKDQQANTPSPNNNVLGIDVSAMRPEYLDQLLSGEIKLNENVKTISDKNISLEQFHDKKINYVYIKLGASSYRGKHIKKIKGNDNYIELAEICEKHKIPYGFYWYSTSYNIPEGKLEADWILDAHNKLSKTDYNLMPMVIDVEVAPNDRQSTVPHEHVTMAKIALTNKLETELGKTKLYTARNAVDDRYSERILDLEEYQSKLKKGPSDIWFVNPQNKEIHNESKERISKSHNVTTQQIALDVTLGSRYKDNILDINIMGASSFQDYINGNYKKQTREILHATQTHNTDKEQER